MIQDKDFTIRLIRQFSNLLAKLILGNTEKGEELDVRVFETNVKDIFRMNFDELSQQPNESLLQWVEEHEAKNQADYLELLAHLFYFKWKEANASSLAVKALYFYERWQEKSNVFSFEVRGRVAELKVLI